MTREDETKNTVEALADLSQVDSAFRDVYLKRARELLQTTFSQEQYEKTCRDRELVDRLSGTVRRAIERHDWGGVATAARDVRELERRLAPLSASISLAEEVYRPTATPTSPLSLEGARLASDGPVRFERSRSRATRDLAVVEEHDPALAEKAALRRKELQGLPSPTASTAAMIDPGRTAETARHALEHHDWEKLESIAERLHEAMPERPAECRCGPPPDQNDLGVDAPSPDPGRAAALGLERVDVDGDASLQSYMSCWCTIHPELSGPGLPSPEQSCGCHDRCPDLDDELRLNLDLFKHRLFLTSHGARYLPRFRAETLLVETRPEPGPSGDVASSAVCSEVGLGRAAGLSRLEIDRALLRHGPDVVASLGLDPWRFCLACIPFDVYLRLASDFGWGRGPHWTHLDGYQVFTGWKLRALAGGHAGHGGVRSYLPLTLTDDRATSLVRFVVVGRGRLITPPGLGAR